MNISSKFSQFYSSPQFKKASTYLVPASIVTVAGHQAYNDYDNASKKDKKNVLVTDALIMLGSMAGLFLGRNASNKFINKIPNKTNLALNYKSKSLKYIAQKINKFPLKEYFEGLSLPLGAILGGGFAGSIAEKRFPVNKDNAVEVADKIGLFADLEYGSLGKGYNLSGMPAIDAMDSSLVVLSGFGVGRESGVKNKIKRAVFEIVSGVIVPLSIIIPATGFLKGKLSGKGKAAETLFAALTLAVGVSCCYIGKAVGKMFNKKVTENVMALSIFDVATKKQKELLSYNIQHKDTLDIKEKENIAVHMKKLSEVKSQMANEGVDFENINHIVSSAKLDLSAKEIVGKANNKKD